MTGGSTRVQSRLRRLLGVATAAMVAVAAVGCGTGSGEGSAASSEEGPVTLEFAQWWAPELPEGSFQELMTQFESQNPNIKVELLSGPYASTKQQLVSGAASKTLPDVVGRTVHGSMTSPSRGRSRTSRRSWRRRSTTKASWPARSRWTIRPT